MEFKQFIRRLGMSLVTGIIHAIDQGTVSKGHFAGSLFKTITLTTGNKLTAFDVDFVEGLEIGKEYTFPVEQSGTYTNIIGTVTPVTQVGDVIPITDANQEVAIAKPAEEVLPKVQTPEDRDSAIRRAVALKAAVEYVGINLKVTSTPEEVIALAKLFEAYLK